MVISNVDELLYSLSITFLPRYWLAFLARRYRFITTFANMKEALKLVVVLFLSVGVLFFTTGIESCFGSMDNCSIAQLSDSSASGDIENSDSLHPFADDLFTGTGKAKFNQVGFLLNAVVFTTQHVKNSFITAIWQPPKIS